MAKEDSNANKAAAEDEELDEWDKRIYSTGCAVLQLGPRLVVILLVGMTVGAGFAERISTEENTKMTDCYWEKHDWRACAEEMTAFRQCWKAHNNDERTDTKDADKK